MHDLCKRWEVCWVWYHIGAALLVGWTWSQGQCRLLDVLLERNWMKRLVLCISMVVASWLRKQLGGHSCLSDASLHARLAMAYFSIAQK